MFILKKSSLASSRVLVGISKIRFCLVACCSLGSSSVISDDFRPYIWRSRRKTSLKIEKEILYSLSCKVLNLTVNTHISETWILVGGCLNSVYSIENIFNEYLHCWQFSPFWRECLYIWCYYQMQICKVDRYQGNVSSDDATACLAS